MEVTFAQKKKEKEKEDTIKSIFKGEQGLNLEQRKGKKDSAMNYEQCWSSSSSGVCRGCVEYKTHLSTLSVC